MSHDQHMSRPPATAFSGPRRPIPSWMAAKSIPPFLPPAPAPLPAAVVCSETGQSVSAEGTLVVPIGNDIESYFVRTYHLNDFYKINEITNFSIINSLLNLNPSLIGSFADGTASRSDSASLISLAIPTRSTEEVMEWLRAEAPSGGWVPVQVSKCLIELSVLKTRTLTVRLFVGQGTHMLIKRSNFVKVNNSIEPKISIGICLLRKYLIINFIKFNESIDYFIFIILWIGLVSDGALPNCVKPLVLLDTCQSLHEFRHRWRSECRGASLHRFSVCEIIGSFIRSARRLLDPEAAMAGGIVCPVTRVCVWEGGGVTKTESIEIERKIYIAINKISSIDQLARTSA